MTENKTIHPHSAFAQIREGVRSHRAAKRQLAALEADLATYRTPYERAELDAIIDRADPAAAAVIRPIWDRVRAA